MDDMLGIVVAEEDSDGASSCVCVSLCMCASLPRSPHKKLCIERELRRHLKGNKRDNKAAKEENEDVMKEEHESV